MLADTNRTIEGQGANALGGFLDLSGLQQDQLLGRHSGLLVTAYMQKLNKSHYFSAYLGASLEIGNTWIDSSDIGFSSALTAGSVFIGVDSPIGPIYAAYGAAEGGEKSLYLIIGSPWF